MNVFRKLDSNYLGSKARGKFNLKSNFLGRKVRWKYNRTVRRLFEHVSVPENGLRRYKP